MYMYMIKQIHSDPATCKTQRQCFQIISCRTVDLRKNVYGQVLF